MDRMQMDISMLRHVLKIISDLNQSNDLAQYLVKTLFQVRVIESSEPSPSKNALTYGQLVGYFSERKRRSYQSCANKFVSFDLPLSDAIDYGQVFVILKRDHNLPQNLPEIKIYGERDEGNFF